MNCYRPWQNLSTRCSIWVAYFLCFFGVQFYLRFLYTRFPDFLCLHADSITRAIRMMHFTRYFHYLRNPYPQNDHYPQFHYMRIKSPRRLLRIKLCDRHLCHVTENTHIRGWSALGNPVFAYICRFFIAFHDFCRILYTINTAHSDLEVITNQAVCLNMLSAMKYINYDVNGIRRLK